jgi:8-oxo-dGTP pyrophosphatase MutT (NUDIX family)
MPQMYKVFIDNTEIRFVQQNKKKVKKGFKVLELADFNSNKAFFARLKELNAEKRIIVKCSDVDNDFERVFKSYAKISAAGGIVERKKSILIIKRLGKWDLPKGKIEKDEIPQVAAYREIEEECGISGHVLYESIGETYHTYTHKSKKVLKRNYWYYFLYSGPKKLTVQVEEDITDAKWLKKSDLKEIKQNTYASINAVLKSWEKKFG